MLRAIKAKMHQIDFGWGSAPDVTPLGSLQLSPDPLARLRGTSKVREGREGQGEKGKGKGREETPIFFYLH